MSVPDYRRASSMDPTCDDPDSDSILSTNCLTWASGMPSRFILEGRRFESGRGVFVTIWFSTLSRSILVLSKWDLEILLKILLKIVLKCRERCPNSYRARKISRGQNQAKSISV